MRHLSTRGGFFTENLLLRLRDKPEYFEEMRWTSFGQDEIEEQHKYAETWEWVKLTLDLISSQIDEWKAEERFARWIGPLLKRLRHQPEVFPQFYPNDGDDGGEIKGDEDDILLKIAPSHQMANKTNPALHVCTATNLDERAPENYQQKSPHDHLQRYLLLNSAQKWGILTNGHIFRLLGEYSNVYSKGYVEIDLDNISASRDEQEFRVFYGLIHASRFSSISGLNVSKWVKDLDRAVKKKKGLPPISPDIREIFESTLAEMLGEILAAGIQSETFQTSERFLSKLHEHSIQLEEEMKQFLLERFERIITEIADNVCIIARLQLKSTEEGVEIGKKLRENVRLALETMGEGLLQSNSQFSQDLRTGIVDIRSFFQELLRVTYRLIFVFFAESKHILPGATTAYARELSLNAIRQRAEQPVRDDRHFDLWDRLFLLFHFLDKGYPAMGVNAFSGPLFDTENLPLLRQYALRLPNSNLLSVFQQLCIIESEGGRQKINYGEIGEEEIGGIYESLLDFQPRYVPQDSPAFHFILESIETERKGTGTFYTPKSLIDILLRTAILPVINKKLEGVLEKDLQLRKILEIKVCDPACGGGSFLLAVLDYLGLRYTQIEQEQDIPDEEAVREGRRKILQHCIYGVDLNPMAIELAKISLWLKASVKDKPLTFLDNHLKVGNSLIGFAKKQKVEQISIDAFNAIKGNPATGVSSENAKILAKVKKVVKTFARSSRSSGIQQSLLVYQTSAKLTTPATEVLEMDESTLENLQKKIACYNNLKRTKTWEFLNLQANSWTSAFFWEMDKEHGNNVPTDELLQRVKQGHVQLSEPVIQEVNRLGQKFSFFNWYIEFPEVFQEKESGFDCILMNPPWEILLLKEMEFFSGRADTVEDTKSQADRRKAIKNLKEINPVLHLSYEIEWRKMKKFDQYLRNSSLYPNTSRGSINTYAIFAERALNFLSSEGRFGVILPTGFVTNFNMQDFFRTVIENGELISLFDFKNELRLFQIDQRTHFSLLTFGKHFQDDVVPMMFSCFNPLTVQELLSLLSEFTMGQIEERLSDEDQLFFLSKEDFELFNPNTLTCPVFQTRKDVKLARKIYSRVPILLRRNREDGSIERNPWNIDFFTMFHMSNDSGLFFNESDLRQIGAELKDPNIQGGQWAKDAEIYLPLYDGKMIWLYDHRYNSVEYAGDGKKRKSRSVPVSPEMHQNPDFFAIPQFWVNEVEVKQRIPKNYSRKWYLGFRNITGPFAERSYIATILPYAAVGNAIPMILTDLEPKLICCLLANLNSIVFDYMVRLKITGNNMNYYLVEQFPIFPPDFYNNSIVDLIFPRVLELIYCANDLNDFARDCGHQGQIFYWNQDSRAKIQAQLDVIYAHLYGLSRPDLEYILNKFQLLEKYENADVGEFLTKRLILEEFDDFEGTPEKKMIADHVNQIKNITSE